MGFILTQIPTVIMYHINNFTRREDLKWEVSSVPRGLGESNLVSFTGEAENLYTWCGPKWLGRKKPKR